MEIKEVGDLSSNLSSVIGEFLPTWTDIPDRYKSDTNQWRILAEKLIFSFISLSNVELVPKLGTDRDKAIKHIDLCLNAYGIGTDHRAAGIAYLLAEWFEKCHSFDDKE